MTTKRDENKDILSKFLKSKICVWYTDSSEKVIGILEDYDTFNLLLFDEKTKMTILVKRADYFKIERWDGGKPNE